MRMGWGLALGTYMWLGEGQPWCSRAVGAQAALMVAMDTVWMAQDFS